MQLSQQAANLEGSQTGAAQQNTATLTPPAGQTAYLCGFAVAGGGATAALGVNITVTGINTTMNFTIVVPAGVATPVGPFIWTFPTPIEASAVGTAIVVTLPTFGAGNTAASVSAWGFAVQA